MKHSHQAMFNRAFERLYQEAVDGGMGPEKARDWAADQAWTEYEQYCDNKLDELKEDGHERL